jgi:hypothetical protein
VAPVRSKFALLKRAGFVGVQVTSSDADGLAVLVATRQQ